MSNFPECSDLWDRHSRLCDRFTVCAPLSRENSAFRQLTCIVPCSILKPTAVIPRDVEFEIRAHRSCGINNRKVDFPEFCLSLCCSIAASWTIACACLMSPGPEMKAGKCWIRTDNRLNQFLGKLVEFRFGPAERSVRHFVPRCPVKYFWSQNVRTLPNQCFCRLTGYIHEKISIDAAPFEGAKPVL